MDQYIAQGVGYAALLFVILSFQKKTRSALLLIMLAGLLLFTLHYTLLGAWTGALMNLIEAGVVFVAYKKDTTRWAKNPSWLYIFIALYIVLGAISFKVPIDVLPIIAQAFGAIAVWQTNARAIRFLMLIPRPLWFTYNLVVGSQAGVVAEILIGASVLVGIVRFDILPILQRNDLKKLGSWLKRKT